MWRDTYATLHMWTQIVGKIRLACSTSVNHFWNCALYVTSSGLTTSPMFHGRGTFTIDFDFIDHQLRIETSDGERREIPLAPQSVADLYHVLMATLAAMKIDVQIWTMPVEVIKPIRFTEDRVHKSYDPQQANALFRALTQIDRVLKEFRGRFIGKASPVHFFWGSFDMAATRFNGRKAPPRPGADPITAESYSHEEISHGFWPGGTGATGATLDSAAFYAYAAPEPNGFREAKIQPAEAFYSTEFGEYFLRYDDVRRAPSPDQALLDFCQSTYEAGANLAKWDRAALERSKA
jgi:hypothetical protein